MSGYEYTFSYCSGLSILRPNVEGVLRIHVDQDSTFVIQHIGYTGIPEARVCFQFDDTTHTMSCKACYLGDMIPPIFVHNAVTITVRVPKIPWWKLWQWSTKVSFVLSGVKVYPDVAA